MPEVDDARVRFHEGALAATFDQPGQSEFGQVLADHGRRGVGELAERGSRAIGVDVSEQMIAVARHRWPSGDFRSATPATCHSMTQR